MLNQQALTNGTMSPCLSNETSNPMREDFRGVNARKEDPRAIREGQMSMDKEKKEEQSLRGRHHPHHHESTTKDGRGISSPN